MDDQDIPGLMDYIEHPSVTDSPVNRKAYRIAYAMCRQFGDEFGLQMHLMPIWSEALERVTMWIGIVPEGTEGFVPLMMVHQTENQEPLDLRCSPHCEGRPGDAGECRLFEETDVSPAQHKKPGFREVNKSFAHIVQGWDGPLPDITELSKLYDIPTEGEGDAQGNP